MSGRWHTAVESKMSGMLNVDSSSATVPSRHFAWGFVALVLYWMLLAAGTHLPSAWLMGHGLDLNPPAGHRIPHFDKILHASGYFGLTVLLVLVLFHRRSMTPLHYLFLFVGIGLHALADELLQALVPHRSPDPLDWVADMLGASVALIATSQLRSRAKTA